MTELTQAGKAYRLYAAAEWKPIMLATLKAGWRPVVDLSSGNYAGTDLDRAVTAAYKAAGAMPVVVAK